MTDTSTTIHGLVALDEQTRQLGQEPYAPSVRRILDLILKNEAFRDAPVREWAIARASSNDYWIAAAALKIGLQLVNADLTEDALRIAKSVIDTATNGNPEVLGTRDYSHLRELEVLLSQPGLVSAHPATWGRYIIELQAAALFGHREAEWPQTKEFRQRWNEKFGAVYDAVDDFTPEYDDHPDIWYYQHGHLDRDLRGTLSRAIERGLSEAVRLSEAGVFRTLVELLVGSAWAVARCQVLVAMYDFVRESKESESWQIEEAVALASDPRFERMRGATNFRRLLRRSIKERVAEAKREAVVECVRLHAPDDAIRMNELADVAEWGLLTDGESEELEHAKSEDGLFDPYDPREVPKPTASFARAVPSEKRFVSHWPHSEDHRHLELLAENQPPAASADLQEVEEWLLPRVEALKTIAGRDESFDEQWFGEIAGWCEKILEVLKRWAGLQDVSTAEGVECTPQAYLQYLDAHAPWWRQRAEACCDRLQKDAPEHHHKEEEGHLAWSSNDPIYAGLSFLDELLAIQHCPELDTYRDQLAKAITSQWKHWPNFTRATVLTVLRPFHWASIAPLRSLLKSVVEEDRHSDILERSIHHLLRFSVPDIVGILARVWERIDTVSDPENTARLIGEVIGNAVMRHRGDSDDHPVLGELTAWCDQLRCEPSGRPQARGALVHGILWAAKEHAGNTHELTSRHADCWLELALWGAQEFLDTGIGVEGRANTLRAVMFVLEMSWPPAERRRLYEELADVFERAIREGDVGEFSMLHFELKEEIGQRRPDEKKEADQRREVAPTDNLLLRLCKASAERVAEWRRKGEATRDLGYGACLWGGDTGDLIELVFLHARDREFVRRELSPIIDILASAGLTTLATDLRIKTRRG